MNKKLQFEQPLKLTVMVFYLYLLFYHTAEQMYSLKETFISSSLPINITTKIYAQILWTYNFCKPFVKAGSEIVNSSTENKG